MRKATRDGDVWREGLQNEYDVRNDGLTKSITRTPIIRVSLRGTARPRPWAYALLSTMLFCRTRDQLYRYVLLFTLFITVAVTLDESPNRQLLAACTSPSKDDNVEAVKLALQAGASINVVDEASGQTPIMAATLRGKSAIVHYLLQANADVTIGERDGYTPAHGAGFQGRSDIMKLLNKYGVDVLGDKHTDGFYPLHRACWGREARHTETVRYLLSTVGVDVNLASDTGKTCLDMTQNQGTIQLLMEYGGLKSEQEL